MSLRFKFKINIPDTGIVKWKKDFANFGLDLQPKPKADQNLWILINKKNENQTINKGRRTSLENEALRCENELLKKLQALIQAEEKPNNGIKA
jgi:transposase